MGLWAVFGSWHNLFSISENYIMKKLYFASDIELILKLFIDFEYTLSIYDPALYLRDPENVLLSKYLTNGPKVLVILSNSGKSPIVPSSDYKMIFDFSGTNSKTINSFKSFSFKGNCFSNGSISSLISCLNSNTSIGWKGFLGSFFLRGLDKGNFSLEVYSAAELCFVNDFQNLNFDTYSVLFESNSFYKHVVISLYEKEHLKYSILKPFSSQAKLMFKRGERLLATYGDLFDSVRGPSPLDKEGGDSMILSHTNFTGKQSNSGFSSRHSEALVELLEKTLVKKEIYDTDIFQKVKDNFNYIAEFKHIPKVGRILRLLKGLRSEIPLREKLYFSFAHFNFQSSNIQLNDGGLYLSDWRFSQEEIPILYDFFHFHFKRAVINDHSDLSAIQHSIQMALKEPSIANLLSHYEINHEEYYKVYLIVSISYNLSMYLVNDQRCLENEYELDLWEKALMEICPVVSKRSYKDYFVEEFYIKLKKAPHAVLRFSNDRIYSPINLSDFDIFLLEQDLQSTYSFLKAHALLVKSRIFKQSDKWTVDLFFKDASYISINLIFRFKCQSLVFLDGKKLLINADHSSYAQDRSRNKYDLEHVYLFYTLNNRSIPKEYHGYFSIEENMNSVEREKAYEYLKMKYDLKLSRFEDLFQYSSSARNRILNVVKASSENTGITGLTNIISYAVDEFKSLFRKKGMAISVAGVDDRGKDLVLYGLKVMMENKYHREVVILKNSPRFFNLNNWKVSKNNSNGLQNIYRLGIQMMDYLMGQLVIKYKYIYKGKVVIYDQYFSDVMEEDRLKTMFKNPNLFRRLYYLVRKPNLNYFLCGGIVNRYQHAQFIKHPMIGKIKRYKELFRDLKSVHPRESYTLIKGLDLRETLARMETEIMQKV